MDRQHHDLVGSVPKIDRVRKPSKYRATGLPEYARKCRRPFNHARDDGLQVLDEPVTKVDGPIGVPRTCFDNLRSGLRSE
jgi:hypothetical protein